MDANKEGWIGEIFALWTQRKKGKIWYPKREEEEKVEAHLNLQQRGGQT